MKTDAVDQYTVQHTHLGGGQPDAQRIGHQPSHLLDLGRQSRIELVDRPGLSAQDRIAELPDVSQCGRAPRRHLRI